MQKHKVVSQAEWIAASKQFVEKEKDFTRARDALAAARRALPWVKVEKRYVFDGPNGKQTLADLFDGRSQLIVYHFMYGPDWQAGCPGCSFLCDTIDGVLPHLEHNDVSLVAVSRGPLASLEAYKKRMGWRFRWLSSGASDFNYDFQATLDETRQPVLYNFRDKDELAAAGYVPTGEVHGLSVFFKDAAGDIFHTYSSYARGGEMMLPTYSWLDIVPKGRNEGDRRMMGWMRRHDEYDTPRSAG